MIETCVLLAYHPPMKMGRFTAGWLVIETCVLFAFGAFAEPAPQVVHGVSGVAVQTATINFSKIAGVGTKGASPQIASPASQTATINFSKIAGVGTKGASPQIASPASATNFDAVDDNNTF